MSTTGAKCAHLFRAVLRAIFIPRPREVIWKFLEKVVVVPNIAGSRASGPLDTSLMPQWRGLLELYDDPKVHYFTLAKSARIGGTLFFGICVVIESILRDPGPIGWLGPTRSHVRSLSRREIEPYLHACPPVMALAVAGKCTWTTLEKIFLNSVFTMLGAGTTNELAGRQWKKVVIDEQDRIPARGGKDTPSPSNEAEVRTVQYQHTRKIVRNCTPFSEGGLTWSEFIAGSQTFSYQPCPECHGYQRFTMFKDAPEPERWMRVDEDDPLLFTGEKWLPLKHAEQKETADSADLRGFQNSENPRSSAKSAVPPLRPPDSHRPQKPTESPKHIKRAPDGRGWLVRGIPGTGRIWWPETCKDKKSGRWDVDAVEEAARYECAFCGAHWRYDQLDWMNARYQLRSHNIHAPRDHISAQINSLLSPWQSWGYVAKSWLLAEGHIARVSDFFSLTLGIPRPIPPTKVTPKQIALLQSKSPRYERQFPENPDAELTLPARPVIMTCQSDVNQDGLRYTIRALMPDGERFVLAWGIAGGVTELDRIAARVWKFDHWADQRTADFADGRGFQNSAHPRKSAQSAVIPSEHCPAELRFEEFSCYSTGAPTCIIDTGWRAKRHMGIYQFIHDQGGKWIGAKGGGYGGLSRDKPIAEETMTFDYPGRGAVDVPVVLFNDFLLTEHLSRFVLKEARPPGYFLPIHLDDVFIAELTSPYLAKTRLPDGRTIDKWNFECEPHTYDAEKMGEILAMIYEPALLARMREKQDARRAKLLESLKKS